MNIVYEKIVIVSKCMDLKMYVKFKYMFKITQKIKDVKGI